MSPSTPETTESIIANQDINDNKECFGVWMIVQLNFSKKKKQILELKKKIPLMRKGSKLIRKDSCIITRS